MQFKNTLFNDPIYGFITIETELILQLINHRFFQRLRRISQMGLSSLVYPGAHHTRFEHAIGAMHVMQMAIRTLRQKGGDISDEENEAMQFAILLHDIGHGPFSHASEKILLKEISHEVISLKVFKKLNQEFSGKLDLAIKIFNNKYKRKFMHQLVSGQVDVDRLDYLKRDSFFTGVTEGNINTDRIIAMMNVNNENLVFESKALHSLEKFLLARRLMYWQVYLHKTSLAAELILIKILKRFQSLVFDKKEIITDSHILYHLMNFNSDINLSDSVLTQYLVKKIKLFNDKGLNKDVLNYFIFTGSISNQTYISDNSQILLKNKSSNPVPLTESINYLDFSQFSKPIHRYYFCYPKK